MGTPGAVRVANWNLTAWRRMWGGSLLSSLVQPLLYLLGLGVGVGSLVDRNTGSTELLGGLPYAAYVAPGLMVTTAMTLGAFESMWPVLGGLKWQRGYHAIAATPLEAADIVRGHATWIAVRSGTAAALVAVVLALFPDTRSWGLIPAVLVSTLVGVAFAMPVMATSIDAEMDGQFAAIQRFVIIPLFLFGGAFYPLSQLPSVVQWAARAFPLWHGVVVARSFTNGGARPLAVIGHLAYCVAFVVVGSMISTHRLRRKLYS
ncbi:MAG: hypothetical protein RI900_1470 [Actinomycetota bacterium]|jgi:lipooligosaccharide transport system permease protein